MKVLVGDILQSKAQTLVNTVNCVGVMGKGIALEFKKRFPEMFEDYRRRCERGQVRPGTPYLFRSLIPPHIVNFPTKDHWKSVSRIDDIEKGLDHLLTHCQEWGITSLAIAPLGCGNGQLEWRAVGPLIYRYARQMHIPTELYAPYGTLPRELTLDFLSQAGPGIEARRVERIQASGLNAAWVGLVEILRRIESQPYHWPVGRTIFQKIAYVATRAGLPTGLEYRRGSFGPFSAGLKNVETRLVNDNLLQEERLGRMFRVKVGPNYERVRSEYESALSRWESVIEKTTDLFMRMNTEQAEITATVLFAADTLESQRAGRPLEGEVLASVMDWKQKRRPPVSEADVASTIRNLAMLRWLDVQFDPRLPAAEPEVA
jgi:O-acetyl-ADP-ribose deacetylase (regulator of RNase III)/uncharacterized protein YwgA